MRNRSCPNKQVPVPVSGTGTADGSHTVDTPLLGHAFSLDPLETRTLSDLVLSKFWPRQRRTHVVGDNQSGSCLGATYERSVPRLGHFTERYANVIKCINAVVRAKLGAHVDTFQWASIQVNVNIVSQMHTDSNNIGPSMMVLLGDFTGGSFETHDGLFRADKPGNCVILTAQLSIFLSPFRESVFRSFFSCIRAHVTYRRPTRQSYEALGSNGTTAQVGLTPRQRRLWSIAVVPAPRLPLSALLIGLVPMRRRLWGTAVVLAPRLPLGA